MSMTKQLWSAIIVSMFLALCGSLLASLLSARSYLTEQITLKNIDNANALALSMSQGDIDNARIEVTVAALFDSGQYQLIRVTNPRGRIIVEKFAPAMVADVPPWFVSLLPLDAEPGTAQINNGWKQFGVITLQSETRFAYQSLWKSALLMVGALFVSSLIAGYLGSLILRRLIPPLREVVKQAENITERRFATIALPKVPELAHLARAMNLMVGRLQEMFEHEASRLEAVRLEANFDALTGFANRNFFMARLRQSLAESTTDEQLSLVRLARLAETNQQLGRETTDSLLKEVANAIHTIAGVANISVVGRLTGAEFALLGTDDGGANIGNRLLDAIIPIALHFGLKPEHFVHIGTVRFSPGADISMVLAKADAALAMAEATGRSSAISNRLDTLANSDPRNSAQWENFLNVALRSRQARLEAFPIIDANGKLIAQECPLRLRFDKDSPWLPAGQFIPLVERLNMTALLDITMVELGIEMLTAGAATRNLVLNLSPQSVIDADFRNKLVVLLGKHRGVAARIWFEIAESGALLHLEEVTKLCASLTPLGCRIGIEHFGHEFSQIGRLHQIGLHYLKIDSSFVRDIDGNPGNQAFFKGVRSITHSTGLELHAEGIVTEAEYRQLVQLGFDAFTGPGIRENG